MFGPSLPGRIFAILKRILDWITWLWVGLVAMTGEEKRGFKRLALPFKGTARFSTHGEREIVAKDISAGSAYLIVTTCPDIG